MKFLSIDYNSEEYKHNLAVFVRRRNEKLALGCHETPVPPLRVRRRCCEVIKCFFAKFLKNPEAVQPPKSPSRPSVHAWATEECVVTHDVRCRAGHRRHQDGRGSKSLCVCETYWKSCIWTMLYGMFVLLTDLLFFHHSKTRWLWPSFRCLTLCIPLQSQCLLSTTPNTPDGSFTIK